MKKLIIGVIVSAVLGLGFIVTCVNHVTLNHVGVAYNSVNGSLVVQSNAGWYVTSPMTQCIELSILPTAVTIPSHAKVINTKFVKLNVEHIKDFIALQGFSYSLSQMQNDILMGYAFSGQEYNFLTIVQQPGIENSPKSNR